MSEEFKTFTGELIAMRFEDGKHHRFVGCEDCECQEHDEDPSPAGTYVTIRLDDPKFRLGFGQVTVAVRDDG